MPHVFILVAPLPMSCLPLQVIRHLGVTIVWADPSALRAEVVMAAPDVLTDAERRSYRQHFDLPLDLTRPIDDDLLDGPMDAMALPPSVRVPDAALDAVLRPTSVAS